MNREKRFNNAEFRAETREGKMYISGYAAVFNTVSNILTKDGKEFREKLLTGCFDAALADPDLDVILDFNHDLEALPLARLNSRVQTLKLTVDDKGLWFEAELANTTQGRDLFELLQRGDLDSCSFVFICKTDSWSYGEDGIPVREISEIYSLHDVSIVTNPAYSEARVLDAELRGLKELTTEKKSDDLLIYKMKVTCLT